MAEARVDVAVVGGGMVGLALAAALADAGFHAGVVEAREPRPWRKEHMDNRVSALSVASRRMLERLGAWATIERQRACCFEAIHAWDAAGSPGVTFDAADRGVDCLGHIVENSCVVSALRQAVGRRKGVDLYCPAPVAQLRIDDDGARVRLEDGRRLHADLVVGADGARSLVRAAAGIEADEGDYEQHGIVATVTPERHHGQVARQRFLPTGPLALLPLADGRCSIVWSARSDRAEELLALDEDAFHVELENASERVLGGILASADRAGFPLRRLHARHYVAPRIALVGDAAHVIHPLAGQGVNLGFLDAAALVDCLARGGSRGQHPGRLGALRRYERWRRGDNALMQNAMDGFHWLFANDDPLRATARNLGLQLTDRLTPIKGPIIDHAMGLRGELPSLMQG